ncbi:DsbA family oxidoreductase [Spongiivirga citrea]|uniref:Disulfide bond formation protein DsbA n=1 Tax=Spongiivirga citrea TaxID=1481457 RepID=A0A6M0CJ42_9FLAO|nr:DsbA family oxidoreductase [Spongiivirga citrea]NER17003.1 disulfide bond formation protein DsbA [Spongiivirga citrea]
MVQKQIIKLDVVSDVACPWCYVGKRRLEKALTEWKGATVEVTWHPFQLDPSMPESGLNRDTYLLNKFGDLERTKSMTDRLVEAGKEEGITFNFGDKWLAVNTLPLHQLLHVAGEEGFRDTLKERFLKAYFDENLHLNDIDVLVEVMSEYGWDAEKTKRIIADDSIGYTVKQEIAHYQQRGVTGVPFFILNDKYGFSGAQPPHVFLDAFAKVSPIEVIAEGDHCDSNTKEC